MGVRVNHPLPLIASYAESDVLAAAFAAAPLAMALVGRERVSGPLMITAANRAFQDLLGAPAAPPGGLALEQVFRATAGSQIRTAVSLCLRTGETVRVRVAHIRAERLARIAVEVRCIGAEAGPSVLLSAQPLTHRLPLAELGESGVLSEIGPLSRGCVYIRDVDSGRMHISPHPLAKRLGLTGAYADNAHCAQLIHPEDLDRYARYLADQRTASDGDVCRTTIRVRDIDGALLWVNFRSRTFARDNAGAVRQVLGVATDVSDTFGRAEAQAEAAAALAQAEINERRRIGLELHDSTAQLLVAAQLNLGMVQKRADLPERAQPMFDAARSAIREAQQEIRAFAFILHPPSLTAQSLAEMLKSFANGFAQRTGLTISCRIIGTTPKRRLGKAAKLALIRITQEALMNVYRHALAEKVWVRLIRAEEQVTLEIEDDGVGLRDQALPPPDGVGISGMRARMVQVGGRFELTRGVAGGILVRATLPTDNRPPA